MGVLTTGSAHDRPSARPPIEMSGHFSVHMSGGAGQKLMNMFLTNFLAISGKNYPKKAPQGSFFFFGWNPNIFVS